MILSARNLSVPEFAIFAHMTQKIWSECLMAYIYILRHSNMAITPKFPNCLYDNTNSCLLWQHQCKLEDHDRH